MSTGARASAGTLIRPAFHAAEDAGIGRGGGLHHRPGDRAGQALIAVGFGRADDEGERLDFLAAAGRAAVLTPGGRSWHAAGDRDVLAGGDVLAGPAGDQGREQPVRDVGPRARVTPHRASPGWRVRKPTLTAWSVMAW